MSQSQDFEAYSDYSLNDTTTICHQRHDHLPTEWKVILVGCLAGDGKNGIRRE